MFPVFITSFTHLVSSYNKNSNIKNMYIVQDICLVLFAVFPTGLPTVVFDFVFSVTSHFYVIVLHYDTYACELLCCDVNELLLLLAVRLIMLPRMLMSSY